MTRLTTFFVDHAVFVVAFLCLAIGCTTSNDIPPVPRPPITGVFTSTELQELLREWDAADGESVSIVSDRLAFFLAANPRQFYAGMDRHRPQFDRWLRLLGGTTLTVFGRSCIDRRCLRERMIQSVEQNPASRPAQEDLRSRVLKVLHETEVRTVD